jgi:hypothetical protein
MLLRDHSLMTYQGANSWPPRWERVDGLKNPPPQGEIGILRELIPSYLEPCDRCYLRIDHEGSTYVGCLLIDDSAFCGQIVKTLLACCGCSIADIGSLDLSDTF